ncbi:MAG TPA: hypothetical protein VMD58_05195 [Acidobacteriaceae bacterium]|nr:hypothetical protein [Acidobacteriaceae bacterium]
MSHVGAVPAVSSSDASPPPGQSGASGKTVAGRAMGELFGALVREKASISAAGDAPMTGDRSVVKNGVVLKAVSGQTAVTGEAAEDGNAAEALNGIVPRCADEGPAKGSELTLDLSSTVTAGEARAQGSASSTWVEGAKSSSLPLQTLGSAVRIADGALKTSSSGVGTVESADAKAGSKVDTEPEASPSAQATHAQHKGKKTNQAAATSTTDTGVPSIPAQAAVNPGAPAAAPLTHSLATLTTDTTRQENTAPASLGEDSGSPDRAATPKMQLVVATGGNKASLLQGANPATNENADGVHGIADTSADAKATAGPASEELHPGSIATGREAAKSDGRDISSAQAGPWPDSATHVSPHIAGAETVVLPHAAGPTTLAQGSQTSGAASAISGTSGLATANPYDRIDQGNSPVVLHSGVQHVDVGVHDPQIGWVEIHAQSSAGRVDATLAAASGQAHSELAAQLPAIAQYMQERDVQVGTLAVHHQATQSGTGVGTSSGFSGGSSTGTNSGSGGSGAQRFREPDPGRSANAVRPLHPQGTGSSVAISATPESPLLRPVSYISVRA